MYFHILNEGRFVIFRSHEDSIFFTNKFAMLSYSHGISVLAETTMSTHFHAIVEVSSESSLDSLLEELKNVYSWHYSREYGHLISDDFNIKRVELTHESLRDELTYVIRNPMHHYVSSSPFSYVYSCGAFVFFEEMMSQEMSSAIMSTYVRIGDLPRRKQMQISRKASLPDNWLVNSKGMIIPLSWLRLSKTRAIWDNNFREFLFSMNTKLRNSSQEFINNAVLAVRSEKYDDFEVCSMIDGYARSDGNYRSVHFLPDSIKQDLLNTLLMRNINREQAMRCLWLSV